MAFSFQKLWNTLKKPYAIAMGTGVMVSAVWLFFYTQMKDLKDERINALQDEVQRVSRIAAIPDTIEKIEARLRTLERQNHLYGAAFPIDEFTGRITLGNGIATGTPATTLVKDAQQLMVERKFDLAERKVEEAEKLIPGFTGALYLRWALAANKGYTNDAIAFGEQVLKRIPKDERIKDVYTHTLGLRLAANQRKEAEQLALAMVRAFPSDTNVIERFERTFGYRPTVVP
jgi:hypothetical protein